MLFMAIPTIHGCSLFVVEDSEKELDFSLCLGQSSLQLGNP
jgi:hypothetical protein